MIAGSKAAVTAVQSGGRATVSFEFMIDAPIARASLLFGPEAERAWAGAEWDPRFVYPATPQDTEGAVFTITGDGRTSVWVNTEFDPTRRIHYVAFLPGVMVTTIEVLLEPQGTRTSAKVTYVRTALNAQAEPNVLDLSRGDAEKGAQWRAAIAARLRSQSSDQGNEP